MTIIDADNNGIGVFNDDNTVGYVVQEGDSVRLKGTISQFNGLTQLRTDSLEIINIGNELVTPIAYDGITDSILEENESSLVSLFNVAFVDESQWAGDGSSFNVDLASVDDPTKIFVMRIDNDTELASMPFPGSPGFNPVITGLQGQFDSSDPFDSGYQILPRYMDDIVFVTNTNDPILDQAIQIYPNPALEYLEVSSELEIDTYQIFNQLGQLIQSSSFENKINISYLPEGNYFIQFNSGDKLSNKQFIKIK